MALIRVDHTPETVKINLPLTIIVPEPGRVGDVPIQKRKVLYLLHGLSEDASAWQRYSSVEALAYAYGLVVIMPSAGRSFYIDQPNGQLYFTYLTEELPRYLSDVFGLAPQRDDTLIAGSSMGGYGAFKAALQYPERFYAAASFSGVLSLDVLNLNPNDKRKAEFTDLFGDLDRLRGGPNDLAVWLQKPAENPSNLPQLFVACSRQEDLYPLNLMFRDACQKLGIPLDYHEEDGKHDWFFWDAQIKRFLHAVLGPPPSS